MGKKYYWIKLPVDFFDRDDIKLILSQENGSRYVGIYLKLILRAIKSSGQNHITLPVRASPENIAIVINEDVDSVRSALALLDSFGLVKWTEENVIQIPGVENMVGSEGASAQRMRNLRGRDVQEQLEAPEASHCDSSVTQRKRKELEKELEIETDEDEGDVSSSCVLDSKEIVEEL